MSSDTASLFLECSTKHLGKLVRARSRTAPASNTVKTFDSLIHSHTLYESTDTFGITVRIVEIENQKVILGGYHYD